MSTTEYRILTPTGWRGRGLGEVTGEPEEPDRESLVRGAYIPSAATTGPLISSWVNQEGNAAGYIQLTTANTHYEGITFWGEVRCRAPGISFNNCRFAGPNPDLFVGISGSCFKSYGEGYYHWRADNCLFDPGLWQIERGKVWDINNFVHVSGIAGGDCELRWCHIRNVVDGIAWVQNDGITDPGNTGWNAGGITVPAGQRFIVVDRCLIEKGKWVCGPIYQAYSWAQSGGGPHCDAFQFNTGRNCWITGTMLGGPRDSAGYIPWPNDGINPGNTGLDYSNAAIMLQQEAGVFDSSDPRYVTNVLIEDNILGGGVASININYKNQNALAGCIIRNNKILQRQSDWGLLAQNGSVISISGGYGWYLAKGSNPSALQCTWQNNTVYETGVLIPF